MPLTPSTQVETCYFLTATGTGLGFFRDPRGQLGDIQPLPPRPYPEPQALLLLSIGGTVSAIRW